MNNSIQRCLEKMHQRNDENKNKCFEEYKSSDGKCYGMVGNDNSTAFLSYSCINCPHHTMTI